MSLMILIEIIIGILFALTTLYGLFYLAIGVLGSMRREKKAPYSPPQKRIAAIIAARNEASVIAQLVKSALAQNYPRELMDVYVIPNNCSDDTEEVARAAGARILHCEVEVHSKGEVMAWTIDKLLADEKGYDGFIILDADNLINPDYFQRANDALCAGANVGQGYRDSKNYTDSWVAGCASEFYWCMGRYYNRARNAIGVSCALNGTGILLSADYMRKHGWHTSSLTEDLEFTAQCALNGERIWWLGDAVAFDEQPLKLIDSYRQRRRWSAGTVQCMRMYFVDLVKKALRDRSLQCLDMAMLFSGPIMQLISIIPGAYIFIRQFVIAWRQGPEALIWALAFAAGSGLLFVLGTAIVSYIILRMEKKQIKGQAGTIWLLWLFLVSWMPANLVSLFTKPPVWRQIEHTRGLDLDEVPKNTGE